ncbi:alpha-N-acetylglucosaminidase [Streptomyces zingiberis]|uniref:Alpha-N-acetylglucosaminidase n=1 Tax=Streptomyces zingiberis TaxID=2053010 RepID=A0ABX1BW97_9ACTN|nr:alpha-N-acetylglucosaminidase [Streptomyces zingiberis]NJP99696.1 alpha-N-acetylglucosaminidase [Streptomyces zingiberis]
MTDLTRRVLLGTAGALGAATALGPSHSAHAAPAAGAAHARAGAARPGEPPFDTVPARSALERLLPGHADQFTLEPLAGGPDRFRVGAGPDGRVEVAGTGPGTLLTGVHWYLKYVCRAHLSWSGVQAELPGRLPAPARPLTRSATVTHRFALNDTHDGYTAPYADWPRWERLIDIMALHGCNEVLVTPGQEAVYHRMLQDFGYSGDEARAWLPAPSHQPWWLLQNMSGYGGPVGPELLARRTELGRRICGRLRELGMAPVVPGYFGTVPDGFAGRNPGARTVPQGTWAGLKRPDWLDPRSPAFAAVARSFYRHQSELFGPVRHFKMDLLHEGGDPGDVPVPEAARAVESALHAARPDAVWVILGWQANPRRELLDALDRERTLIVDGLSDLETVTDREADWGGVPYAFGTIPNFGGRTTIGAKTHLWTERFTVWRDKPGSALAGTAYMAEAAERDPAAFELFSELAWREEAVDRAAWFEGYADLRYGGRDRAAREATAVLRDTAYEISSRDGRPHDSIFAARPSLTARSGTHYATHTPAFDPAAFDGAFAALLAVRAPLRDSDAYRHDLTDLARQALANRSWQLLPQLRTAFEREDRETFAALSALWLELMRLSDEMTGAHRRFLLGPWLADARRMASGEAEADRLERTARVLVTTWADRPTADGGRLANYANRDWNGLIGDFHLPQWQRYLDELSAALAGEREPGAIDWYAVEEPWTRETKRYPEQPVTDAFTTARRVHRVLARAPYQGTVTVTAEPATVPPGGSTELTAAFRNTNGLSPTGRVVFTLTGPGAEPPGPVTLPAVEAGGTAEARWRVAAPEGPPSRPLEPLPYDLTARYGPRGEEPVRASHPGTLYVASPPAAGWRTANGNGALFGQLGDRYAIEGGGADLWKATAEFGALYRPGVLAVGAAVTLRVDTQAVTGPWARAGIIVRDALGTAGSRGFVNLSVTPANGVALSYDADGDGTLDTYRRVTGLAAPVTLRLTRTGARAYRGECSADGGATWRAVAEVTVPGGAGATQDAGMFMSAANGGDGARGLVEFSGWRLS